MPNIQNGLLYFGTVLLTLAIGLVWRVLAGLVEVSAFQRQLEKREHKRREFAQINSDLSKI